MKNTKKLIALLFVTVLVFSMVAHCETAKADEHKPVELEVSIVEPDWLDAFYDEMKPAFEEEYPWITLLEVGTGDDNAELALTRAAANDLPPVLITMNKPTWQGLADEGLLVDVSGYEAVKSVPQGFLDMFTYNGEILGICQGAAYTCLYVNMQILGEAGWDTVPTNWDEFIQCCEDVKTKTDKAPLTYAGSQRSNDYMIADGIITNCVCNELGRDEFETQIKEGKFDFSAYPQIAEKFAQIPQYMMEGSSNYTDDDVIAVLTDGSVAMAFAGNWTAASNCGAIAEATGSDDMARMIAVPFNDEGDPCWISSTPEAGIGMSKVDDPDLAEARDLFFEWVHRPENFRIIQNARGTFPILTSLTNDQIVLPEASLAFLNQTQENPLFTRMYNLVGLDAATEIADTFRDFFAGNVDAETALAEVSASLAADPLVK